MQILKKYSGLINNNSTIFILINVAISGIGLARSFVCLKRLDFHDLGFFTIFQNISFLSSLLQLGIISGAYRISMLDESKGKALNDTLFTFLLITLSVSLLGATVLSLFYLHFNKIIIFSGILLGVLSLYSNWLVSTFLARHKISDLNNINLSSAIIAIVSVSLISIFGIYGAIISVAAQPVAFVCISLLKYPNLRPKKLTLDFKIISKAVSYGFIPFLAGIMFYLNYQIERWSIAYYIDTESLGRFFFAGLYNTIFILVPNSLNTLFFPKSLNHYVNKEYTDLKIVIKKFFVIIIAYGVLCMIVTSFFMKPVIALFFPNHLDNIQYVYIILPGLIAMSLTLPISLLFNSSLMLKPILVGYLISVSMTVILIFSCSHFGYFSLTNVAYIDSIGSIALLIYMLFAYSKYHSKIWN
ncbi:MAG: hypothetical protein AABY93_00505 [Bacteroidota bacterium]